MSIKFGAAGNDPDLFMGALTTLAGDEARAKQALALAEQLTPELQEFDPYLAAMKYFTGMTAAASEPGATLAGSAAQALAVPVNYLEKINESNRKIKASTPQTAISLAQALKAPASASSMSAIAKLNADLKSGRITQEQFDAAFAKATNIAGGGSGASSPLGKLAQDLKNNLITQVEYDAAKAKLTYIAGEGDNKLSTFGILDVETQPLAENILAIETLLDRTVNVDITGNALLTASEVEAVNNAGLLVPKKSAATKITTKSLSQGTLAEYMSAEDAKKFVIDQGLPESSPNFNRIVEDLTAINDDQIGKSVIKNGVFLELFPIYQGENLVNFQLSPTDSPVRPYFTTYTEKRLPLLAKSADTYNVQAIEVIPRVDEALALLKTGQVTTGLLAEKMLPYKQIFTQMFGINDPEITNLLTLQATSNFMAPKMRPVGSGSTSDMEFRAYQKAALFIGNTPEANYISLYAFKNMAENAIELNRKERELLTSNDYSDLTAVNNQLKREDSGIFAKYDGNREGQNAQEDFQSWYDSLEDGTVIINNNLFEVNDAYVIKGWGS